MNDILKDIGAIYPTILDFYNSIRRSLNLEEAYDMYIEIHFKKITKILSANNTTWSDIVNQLEIWINECCYKDDIDYVVIKADKIEYYEVNTIIKNLTKKVTLIRMKEKPNVDKI